MNTLFKLDENQTTVKTEVAAGITTFFTMAYIIFLNPVFLSSTGMDTAGVLIATCISAAIGCTLCAFISNKPFAMASGMGMNAFFAYSLCGIYGYTWQQALAMTLISGLLFLVIVLSPLRKAAITAIPENMKHAITAGIGLFIALIGLLDGGIISLASGFPALGDLSSKAVLIAIAGLLFTSVLVARHVKGSLIIGMIFTVILNLILGQTAAPTAILSMPTEFSKVFFKMDFTGLIHGSGISAVSAFIAIIISMTMVDMFDTLGFLIGVSTSAGISSKEGESGDLEKVLISDAFATVAGSFCGTSTVTTYAESASGIAEGGKTGLTSLTVAACFLLSIFLSPLAGVVTSSATAPALIIVGMYLLMDIKNVDFSEMDEAIPAFLTVAAIPFAYSITTGIGAGFITYIICKAATGRFKQIKPATLVLALVFALYFCLC